MRRDGAIVELTVDKSSVAGYLADGKVVSAGSCRISTVRTHSQGMAAEDTAGWKKA
jgi:hypothetical protein